MPNIDAKALGPHKICILNHSLGSAEKLLAKIISKIYDRDDYKEVGKLLETLYEKILGMDAPLQGGGSISVTEILFGKINLELLYSNTKMDDIWKMQVDSISHLALDKLANLRSEVDAVLLAAESGANLLPTDILSNLSEVNKSTVILDSKEINAMPPPPPPYPFGNLPKVSSSR